MSDKILSDIKPCCADLYAKPVVAWLLGDSLHPGGLALTQRLGRMLKLTPSDRALDIACGSGASAMLLAGQFGCRVTGVDLAPLLVSGARAAATREKLEWVLGFALGDAEALPFREASFDAVVSECAISTFLDKGAAAREMARVLKPGGRLGLTDMLLTRGEVPEAFRGWPFQAACIADVWPAGKYQEVFSSAGFSNWRIEKVPEALTELLNQIRARLLALEVAGGLQKLDLSGYDLAAVKQALSTVERWVNSGGLSYGIFFALREVRHG